MGVIPVDVEEEARPGRSVEAMLEIDAHLAGEHGLSLGGLAFIVGATSIDPNPEAAEAALVASLVGLVVRLRVSLAPGGRARSAPQSNRVDAV